MRATWTISIMTALWLVACGDSGPGTTGESQGGTTDDTTGDQTTTTTTTTATTATTTTTGTPTTTDGSQSGTTDPTTGVMPECVSAADCQDMGPCAEAFCEGGMCGWDAVPEGETIDDVPGDCRRTECDGAGGTKEVPSDDPPPQVQGDCKLAACSQGNVEYTIADDDLPNDDNDCTVDTCMMGEKVFEAKAVHSPCGPMGAHFCHSDASCQKCKEVSDACEDYGSEPHETQLTAQSLGEITDADSNGSFACGTIKGAGDVDWYTFSGVDAFLNVVDPSRTLIADMDAARLCVYIACDKGSTTVTCGANDTADVAPGGQKGCCGVGTVSPGLNCGGLDDSAKVWIRVDNPDMLACVPYQLDFHF